MKDVNGLFFHTFENNPAGMTISELSTGKYLYANKAFYSSFGYTKKEVIGKTSLDLDLITQEVREKFFAKLIKNKSVKNAKVLVKKRNGRFLWVLCTTQIFAEKRKKYAITVFHDITEQEKKRKQSLNTNKFLESVLENIPNMVFVKDAKNLNFLHLNKAGEELLGFSQLDLIGKNDYDFFPKEQADYFVAKDKNTLANKVIIDIPEEFIETKKGKRILHTKKITITDDNNNPIYLLGISEDITEKREEEEKLIKQRDQISQLLEFQNIILNGTDYSIITTRASDGIITSFNKGAENMFGYKASEVVGILSPFVFFDKTELKERAKTLTEELNIMVEPGPEVIRIKARLTNTIDKNEWNCLRKDGSRVNIELSMSALRDSENNVIAYLGVSKDITESKKIRDSVIKAKEAAEQANLLKDRFLANMSHEIRTPMNAIIGYTDLLLKKKLRNTEQEYVRVIKNSSENLLHIVNDILDYSKIESGIITFEFNPFNIVEIFGALNDMLVNEAKRNNISLSFSHHSNVPKTVLGDQARLTQILLNLINNALKFTKQGSVKVFAKTINEKKDSYLIEFSVKDTGIGISEDKLQNIFERFKQVESSETRKYGGTGLGLSIVKQLVELHGGEISVKSELNLGSEFVFKLPFKKAGKITSNTKNISAGFNVYDLSNLRVLLAEDNPVNAKFIENLFYENNLYPVDIVVNGKQAVKKIEMQHYDVVLMDIEMQEMSGYEATQIIRTKLKNNVPIIALTAHAIVGEKEKCLKLGMNDFISKPIQADVLFEKIYQAVANKIITKTNKLINLDFLTKSMKGKKNAIKSVMDIFLKQVPKNLKTINEAIKHADYKTIKSQAHNMKSTVSVFGLLTIVETLNEMENLETKSVDLNRIKSLNHTLNKICKQAINEIKHERLSNYM